MSDRRTFLVGSGAVLLATALPAEPQFTEKVHRVGVLWLGSRESAAVFAGTGATSGATAVGGR